MKVVVIFIVVIPSMLTSLSFIELEDHNIPGVSQASLDWGDYDNDGFKDLLITGHTGQERISRVYKTNADSTYTYQETIQLTGVNYGSGLWGDLNNNGYLDIVISGQADTEDYVTIVYENDGFGGFTARSDLSLPGVRYSSLDLIDFNNDGWLDIFISGDTGSECITRLYQNDGDGDFFWREDIVFPGFMHVASCWGDIDRNGFPDLIITGEVNGVKTTTLYLNYNGNTLMPQQNTDFPNIFRGSVALGDFDSDGWLDLLLTGISDSGRVSQIFQNTNGSFSFLTSFTGIGYGVGIWADLNNNGLLDVMISGAESGTYNNIARIYINTGNNNFELLSEVSLNGLSTSDIAITDCNNNGKIDIISTGLVYANSRVTTVYLNQIQTVNTPPTAPVDLITLTNSNHVSLIWNDGYDPETAISGLSYNICLRPLNQPDLQLMAPMADLTNGIRRVSRSGNAGHSNQYSLFSLPAGNYEWAVQTIDSSLTGSEFSPWCSFTYPSGFLPSPANLQIIKDNSQVYLSWDPVEGATMYRIYGSTDPYAPDWLLIATTENTNWESTISHSGYFYRIAAVNE